MCPRNGNWAGNIAYQSKRTLAPRSIDELRKIVDGQTRAKAIGTRHCFNGIADTNGTHISLENLDRVVEIDRANSAVSIEGGIKYGELGAFLHREGFALHNLASLPHISVAGACATATHGSGDQLGNLATAVSEIQFLSPDGALRAFSKQRDSDTFDGAIVHLGALGIVTKLTLDIEPTFHIRQFVYEDLPLEVAGENFDAISSAAYSVSLFTDWTSERFRHVWLKRRIAPNERSAPSAEFFGATLASENHHPLPNHRPECCAPQQGDPGPWHERLPHFRSDFTPSSGKELQTEYFIPREHAYAALEELFPIRERIAPNVFVTEIRTIARDSLWLSPCYKRDCVAIHFTWKQNWGKVEKLLHEIEKRLARFDARPHWGKLFTMSPDTIQRLYPKMADARDLIRHCDPNRLLRNGFTDTYL